MTAFEAGVKLQIAMTKCVSSSELEHATRLRPCKLELVAEYYCIGKCAPCHPSILPGVWELPCRAIGQSAGLTRPHRGSLGTGLVTGIVTGRDFGRADLSSGALTHSFKCQWMPRQS